jgi:predicted anti-sigma-YlaC factor YlaD
MFNCRDVSQKVSESLDWNLPLLDRLLVRLHLAMCKYCNRLNKQLLILRNAARLEAFPEDEIEPTHCLTKDACERIKQAMRDFTAENL